MIKKSLVFVVIALVIPFLTLQCSLQDYGITGDMDRAQGVPGRPGTTGGSSGEVLPSNNLSVPVIWSDGISKPLAGTYGEPVLTYFELVTVDGVEGVPVYPQQDDRNNWQAEAYEVNTGQPITVDVVDWGDNLEAKNWPIGAKIRVETVLYKTFPAQDLLEFPSGMDGFDMVYIEGLGKDESWGTTGNVSPYNHPDIPGNNAIVYSGCARLVIQKFNDFDFKEDCNWNIMSESWGGTNQNGDAIIEEPEFTNGVWDGPIGPESYSAEINIGGKVIYGYNWDTRTTADGPGHYRITFVLSDKGADAVHTFFDSETYILQPVEEEELLSSSERGSDSGETDLGGGTPVIVPNFNLTYIDVELTPKNSGRK